MGGAGAGARTGFMLSFKTELGVADHGANCLVGYLVGAS